MKLDKEFLEILADPETKLPLEMASDAMLENVNRRIAGGGLKNRGGQTVVEKIEAGLVAKTSARFLYPVREGIPVLLIDEGIPLEV